MQAAGANAVAPSPIDPAKRHGGVVAAPDLRPEVEQAVSPVDLPPA